MCEENFANSMPWAFRITNNLEDEEKSMSFAAASKEERKVCKNRSFDF